MVGKRGHEQSSEETSYLELRAQLEATADNILDAYQRAAPVSVESEIHDIAILTQGTGTVAGEILKTYLAESGVPVRMVDSLTQPLGETTLLFVISHSGNDEPTLSYFKKTFDFKCKTLVLTSGGRLMDICKIHDVPYIALPDSLTSQTALVHEFFSMLSVVEKTGLISNQKRILADTIKSLRKDVYYSIAHQVADTAKNKVPIIIASPTLHSVALRWKQQFQEQTKTLATAALISDMITSDVSSLERKTEPVHVFVLRDELDNRHTHAQMTALKKVLSRNGVGCSEILVKGPNLLARVFSAAFIGDWTSYYLSQDYHVDPARQSFVEEIKQELNTSIR